MFTFLQNIHSPRVKAYELTGGYKQKKRELSTLENSPHFKEYFY
jgi:hypothetical protein